jgi:uridine kinase
MSHQTPNHAVIAISGPPGAGKSRLVYALVQKLGEALPLHFDDYQPKRVPPSIYPFDPRQWLADGADPNAWNTPDLATHLCRLRRGEPVVGPGPATVLRPKPWIVLEEPFGRARTAMTGLIDMVVFLEVPLEVVLARRLLRAAERPDLQTHPEEQARVVLDYLREEDPWGRELYRVIAEKVRPHCDLVVDGLQPSEALAATIAEWLRRHVANPPS